MRKVSQLVRPSPLAEPSDLFGLFPRVLSWHVAGGGADVGGIFAFDDFDSRARIIVAP